MTTLFTSAQCLDRGHPLVTYNPQSDTTWCQCGQRVEQGQEPVDWDAKWDAWHDHPREAPCDCYVRTQQRGQELAAGVDPQAQIDMEGAA